MAGPGAISSWVDGYGAYGRQLPEMYKSVGLDIDHITAVLSRAIAEDVR